MPRKSRRKTPAAPDTSRPVPISEVAEQLKAEIPSLKTAAELPAQQEHPHESHSRTSPAAQPEPSRDYGTTDTPAAQPEPSHDSPPFDPTPPRVKSWGETVRPWESYPAAGLDRVEVKAPDMTGIRFSDSRKRTAAEKVEMEAAGLRFWNQPESWLEKATPEARDRTKALARSFAERRMAEDKEKEMGR